ncbi:hypothetical protein BAU07_26190 (plasmid) [Bordetella flabilis]|uniref:Type IV secretion protein DotG n=2 Tax=Bordetella flabilis TaxID=463014 RepID=A0A193GLS3_9BORD|nr:hypothetical protein BAU07_26190 [Bordetella flabilis]
MPARKARPAPRARTDEWRRNLKSVFGHGIGRISIIGAAIVILIMIAVGVRTLTSARNKVADTNTAQFEAPTAPSAPIDINPVSAKEAARRNDVAKREAEEAKNSGGSYQPPFIPQIQPDEAQQKPNGTNDIFGGNQGFKAAPATMPVPSATATDSEQRRLLEEARRRQTQAYEDALKKRDAYVTKKQETVLKQLDKMLGQDSLNKIGSNSVVAYTLPVNATAAASQPTGTVQQASAAQSSQRTPVIRTGNVLYAETIPEVNTDKGMDVMAVVRGGAWEGSILIGRVEQRPDDIGFRFTTLAPQDGRPSMSINAVAMKTENASLGVAENIDHHTLERYGSLGAASLLSGFGKAYAQTPGTAVIVPSGTTVTSTQEPSNKQVIATSVGELGTNFSQEIRRGFDRQATFSTPKNQGIAVFFLSDVYVQN